MLLASALGATLAQKVGDGEVRNLTMRSKISRAVLNNIAEHAGVIPPDILRSITQAGGGTLYDLIGKPVYYEVSLNRGGGGGGGRGGRGGAGTRAAGGATNV